MLTVGGIILIAKMAREKRPLQAAEEGSDASFRLR
jgi:hypothetical protein